MNPPKLTDLDLSEKSIIIRADLDVLPSGRQTGESAKEDNLRLQSLIPTLDFVSKYAKLITLMGHSGRPGGKEDEKLSLKPVSKVLEKILEKKWGKERVSKLNMHMMENLRFNPGEEANDPDYAKHLAVAGEVYINEAFSVSHREHASIVSLPKVVKDKGGQVALGLRFANEIKNLSKIFNEPKRPVIVLISGVKKGKLDYVKGFSEYADKILIAGRLPVYLEDKSDVSITYQHEDVIIANLIYDKEDITIKSIERFENEIETAGTIIVSGPVGKFEEEGHRQGTERVLKAVVSNKGAFKVAGGGDTQKAIRLLSLEEGFDWISVGGGAMLEFLTKKTLPGIEALKV